MAKIDYTYFECPEADCPMMTDDMPCIIQIAEGERRRCPCEKKIKLTDEHRVPPPPRTGGFNPKILMIAGGALVVVLIIVWLLIPKPPVIGVTPSTIAFGASPLGSKRSIPVIIKNTGKGKLKLESVKLETGGGEVFSIADYKGEIVKPNETKEIGIVFQPVEGGPYTETLTIRSNDPNTKKNEIKITGSVAVDLEEAIKEAFGPLDDTSTILK